MKNPHKIVCFLLLQIACSCPDPSTPQGPPRPCITESAGSDTCATETGERCSLTEAPSTCPTDIAPGPQYNCSWAGRCADDPFLALYCCATEEDVVPPPVLPPFPPNPGDGACRPMGFPGSYGCLPAWFLTGIEAVPRGCDLCSDVGEEMWVCEDEIGKHPSDCARLADAPYQASGFYCCACTI